MMFTLPIVHPNHQDQIADDTHTGRRGFTRAMVPTYPTDHVSSELSSNRKVDEKQPAYSSIPVLGRRVREAWFAVTQFRLSRKNFIIPISLLS
jgi:hypothetical protein